MTSEDLDKKFRTFGTLLVCFVIAGYYPDSKDINTVHKFAEDENPQVVATAIREGREVLAMDPFPWGWVGDSTMQFPRMVDGQNQTVLGDTEANYRIWVTWMVDELEREARRIGKIE